MASILLLSMWEWSEGWTVTEMASCPPKVVLLRSQYMAGPGKLLPATNSPLPCTCDQFSERNVSRIDLYYLLGLVFKSWFAFSLCSLTTGCKELLPCGMVEF